MSPNFQTRSDSKPAQPSSLVQSRKMLEIMNLGKSKELISWAVTMQPTPAFCFAFAKAGFTISETAETESDLSRTSL